MDMSLIASRYIEKNRHDPEKMKTLYGVIYQERGLKGLIEFGKNNRIEIPYSYILEKLDQKKRRNASRRGRKKGNERPGWHEDVRRQAQAACGRVTTKWENMV